MPLNSNALAGDGSVYGADVAGPVDGLYRAIKWDPIYSHLVRLGLTTNLKLCLDDGVGSTFPGNTTFPPFDQSGSSETWRAVQTATLTSQPSWANSIHKAAAVWSAVAFYYHGFSGSQVIVGDDGTAANAGFQLGITAADKLQIYIDDATGGAALSKTSDGTLTVSSWNMIGVSITEAGGAAAGFLYANGGYAQVGASNTWNPAYTSPSAGAAGYTIQVGAAGNNSRRVDPLGRVSSIAVFQGTAISKANMDSIWAAMRGRYGL